MRQLLPSSTWTGMSSPIAPVQDLADPAATDDSVFVLDALASAEIRETVLKLVTEEQRTLQLLVLRSGSIGRDDIFELLVATVGRVGRGAFRDPSSEDRASRLA